MNVFGYCILLSLFTTLHAFAQTPENSQGPTKPGSILSAHLGSFLPNQIDGVTEVLPMWGAGYAISSRGGFIELGGLAASAHGVKYFNAYAEVRGDFPVEDLLVTAGIGADVHLYTPPGTTANPNPKNEASGGGHVSGGVNAHLADNLWFKVMMKFNVSPGTSMYFGFGFEIRPPAGQDNESQN